MIQDVQYDPETGEIVAIVTYSELPKEMPKHSARVIVSDKRAFVPMHDLLSYKVDRADPLTPTVRVKSVEEKLVESLKVSTEIP